MLSPTSGPPLPPQAGCNWEVLPNIPPEPRCYRTGVLSGQCRADLPQIPWREPGPVGQGSDAHVPWDLLLRASQAACKLNGLQVPLWHSLHGEFFSVANPLSGLCGTHSCRKDGIQVPPQQPHLLLGSPRKVTRPRAAILPRVPGLFPGLARGGAGRQTQPIAEKMTLQVILTLCKFPTSPLTLSIHACTHSFIHSSGYEPGSRLGTGNGHSGGQGRGGPAPRR